MPVSRIIVSLSNYSDTELDNKAQSIYNAVKGSKIFETPTPPLAELEAALKAYSEALAAADQGGRLQVVQKNAARKVLEGLLRTLAAYVTMIAKGDKEILASSGFDLASETSNTRRITAPTGIEVIIRSNPGEVEVKIDPVKDRRLYHYEYTTDPVTDNSDWTQEPDTVSKHLLTGLQTGKKYWFRVVVLGKGGAKEYSNQVSCIVQ